MNGTSAPSRGFVYVVNDEKYLLEGLVSVESLRRMMPDACIAVICPPNLFRPHPAVNHWIPFQNTRRGPIVKTDAILAPFDRVAFVDTDTLFVSEMMHVFDVLDAFDMALALEPTGGLYYKTEAAIGFCELNTGFILFRNDAKVRQFFQDWETEYDRMLAEQKLRNDQASFRSMMWKNTGIRLATLPSEYHCICDKPMSIAWEARLLHGRGDLAAYAREINREFGCRAFVPGLGRIGGFHGRKKWVLQYLRLTGNFLRAFFFSRYRADVSKRTPIRWDKESVAQSNADRPQEN